MGRMIYIDVLRSTCMAIVVILHGLEITNACKLECNWTQPAFYFEYMSGLFFMISGVVGGLSMCGQLERHGRCLPVLRSHLLRGIVLAAIGLSMQSVEKILRPLFSPEHPFEGVTRLLDVERVRRQYIDGLYVAISDPRALAFHGACTFLSACALALVVRLLPSRRPPGGSQPGSSTAAAPRALASSSAPAALLVLAAAVLIAHPPLRRLADEAACCHEQKCKNTDTAQINRGIKVRVPSRCQLVLGNGTRASGSEFDPCDFDARFDTSVAAGGVERALYLPPCGLAEASAALAALMNATHYEVTPTLASPCERAPRRMRASCTDGGPWRAGEHPPTNPTNPTKPTNPTNPTALSCAELAADGLCGASWATVGQRVAGGLPVELPHDEPVAEWCARARAAPSTRRGSASTPKASRPPL